MNRVLVLMLGLTAVQPVFAGSYLTDINFAQDENAVNHPVLYVGGGGVHTIRVCLDPQITDVDLREPSIERAIATWNAMSPQSNNVTADVPADFVDFESAVLHEMGHCFFGLAHPNLGLSGDVIAGLASQADVGPNGVFDIGLGGDGQPGSVDDSRGDDINRVWYYTFDNYPFLVTLPVDKTTYSRDLDDLPPGSLFAANANRLSGPVSTPSVTNTESVMNAYILPTEGRKILQHDDISTFLYAASGLDEMAGTADDYTVEIVYQGRTTIDCDVLIEGLPSGAPPGAAGLCEADAIGIGGAKQHFRIAGLSRVQMADDDVDLVLPGSFFRWF